MKLQFRIVSMLLLIGVVLAGCSSSAQSYHYVDIDVSESVQAGEDLLEEKKYSEAMDYFLLAMEQNPKNIPARLGSAKVHIALENYDEALSALSVAAKVENDNRAIYELMLELAKTQEDSAGYTYIYHHTKDLAKQYGQTWFFEEYVPDKPEISLPSGEYSERQQVTIELPSDADEMYFSLSVKERNFNIYEMEYVQPVVLPRGTSTLSVYSVRNGVPSDTVELEYTCEIPEQVIQFADPGFEQLVRQSMNRTTGDITDADCEMATYLSGSYHSTSSTNNTPIYSLEDLQWFPFLNDLYLNNYREIEDWTPVSSMSYLNYLSLQSCDITDIDFIKGLPRLYQLMISNNEITDISPLSSLSDLMYLYIYNNPVADLSPLWEMESLLYLDCDGSQIVDPYQLVTLKSLEYIEFNDDPEFADWDFLYQMDTLNGIGLRRTQDVPVQIISTMTHFTRLTIVDCDINDLSFLNDLTELESLDLAYNDIQDVSVLKNMRNLQYLSLYGNPINQDDIDALTKDLPNVSISFW